MCSDNPAARQYDEEASQEPEERPLGGELNGAISRAIVRHHAQLLGRGPTRAQAFYRGNVVVVVLEEVMTAAERSLAAAGRADAVLQARQAYQHVMGPHLRSTVERLTGCKVRAFMSANHIDPDLAAEVFVLDRPVSDHQCRSSQPAPMP